jgi:hypothetical protein
MAVCDNCKRTIEASEKDYIFQNRRLCVECYEQISVDKFINGPASVASNNILKQTLIIIFMAVIIILILFAAVKFAFHFFT